MLELGGNGAPADDPVKDVNEANFMAEVVEASQEVPVIVDFWAPWCGPCRTLGPALEEAVRARKGAVRMAKVNVDQNQMIAAQLRIQSIPTVYAFYKGQPIDGFQGAIPPSEVKAFVERVAAAAGDAGGGGLEEAVAAAEEMLAEGAAVDAAQTFSAVLQEDPKNAAAYGGLVRAHLALGDLAKAEALLEAVPEELAQAQEVEAARAQLALARQAEKAGPVEELRQRVADAPDDLAARYELALALQAAGDLEGAIDQLLEIIRRDASWNDGQARKQLFTIFDAMKPNDPVVLKGRRKLSSLMFA